MTRFTVRVQRVEIERGGVGLSCLVGGSGRPVVLLHGLAGSAREMAATAEPLIANGHRVIAVDQRGHGRSTRRPDDLSRRAYVRDVVAVVNELAGGPVTVVGQSMGGHTAMLVTAWHPAVVERLVMLEAGVGGGIETGYPARLGAFFGSWPVPFSDTQAAAEFLGPAPIARAWVSDLEQRADGWWPRFDADVMQDAITAVAEEARWAEWRSVTAPTLLVRGERGTTTAAEVQQMVDLRPDVEHVVVPDAGHDVHLEQHAAWMRLLTAFLGRPGHPNV